MAKRTGRGDRSLCWLFIPWRRSSRAPEPVSSLTAREKFAKAAISVGWVLGVYLVVFFGTGGGTVGLGAVFPAVVIAALLVAFGLLPESAPKGLPRLVTGGVVFVGVAIVLGFWGVPGWIAAQTYDGALPTATVARGGNTTCSSPNLAGPAYRWPVSRRDGSPLGIEEVVYSPQCQTAWLRFDSNVPGVLVVKAISRPLTPLLAPASAYSRDVVGKVPQSFTPQVYAPACVAVTLRVVENGRRIDMSSTHLVCRLHLALLSGPVEGPTSPRPSP